MLVARVGLSCPTGTTYRICCGDGSRCSEAGEGTICRCYQSLASAPTITTSSSTGFYHGSNGPMGTLRLALARAPARARRPRLSRTVITDWHQSVFLSVETGPDEAKRELQVRENY